jgi:hypothetical protein
MSIKSTSTSILTNAPATVICIIFFPLLPGIHLKNCAGSLTNVTVLTCSSLFLGTKHSVIILFSEYFDNACRATLSSSSCTFIGIDCNRNVRQIFGVFSTIGLGGVLDDEEVEVKDLLIAAAAVFWRSTRAAAVCRGTETSGGTSGPKHAGTVRGVLDASALPEFWAKIPVA